LQCRLEEKALECQSPQTVFFIADLLEDFNVVR